MVLVRHSGDKRGRGEGSEQSRRGKRGGASPPLPPESRAVGGSSRCVVVCARGHWGGELVVAGRVVDASATQVVGWPSSLSWLMKWWPHLEDAGGGWLGGEHVGNAGGGVAVVVEVVDEVVAASSGCWWWLVESSRQW